MIIANIRQFRSQLLHKCYGPLIDVDGRGGDIDAWADSMVNFNIAGVVNVLVSVILMWPPVELATDIVYRSWFWSMISVARGVPSLACAGVCSAGLTFCFCLEVQSLW